MSSRTRRHSPIRYVERLYKRYRPMIITAFAASIAVLGALFIFTQIHTG